MLRIRSSFRTWVAWGVFLTLFWTTAAGFWGSFSHAVPIPTASLSHIHDDEEAEHKRYCHCLSCPGGKQCCCLSLKGTAASLVLRAACDSDQTLTASPTVAVAVVPVVAPKRPLALLPVPPPAHPLPPVKRLARAVAPLAPPPQPLS